MHRVAKIAAALILSGLVLAACGSPSRHATSTTLPSHGYGLVVGNVGPCTAEQFDASPGNPIIVILSKDARTFATYNVTLDHGTTSYHFDVPAGDYEMVTTWTPSRVFTLIVRFGKTLRRNIAVSCWIAVPGNSTDSPATYAQQLNRADLKIWEVCAPTYRPFPGYGKIAFISPSGVRVHFGSFVNVWVGGNPPGCHKKQKHEGPVQFPK